MFSKSMSGHQQHAADYVLGVRVPIILTSRSDDTIFDRIAQIKAHTKADSSHRPRWPMVILRGPKGWTGPKVDGKMVEGHWRSHHVPVANCREDEDHRQILEEWLRSYDPDDLFDDNGTLKPELKALSPERVRRMGANPHANGGLLRQELITPYFRSHAVHVPSPGAIEEQSTKVLRDYLRDVLRLNHEQRNFPIRTPASSISLRTRRLTLCAYICRRMQIPCYASPTIA